MTLCLGAAGQLHSERCTLTSFGCYQPVGRRDKDAGDVVVSVLYQYVGTAHVGEVLVGTRRRADLYAVSDIAVIEGIVNAGDSDRLRETARFPA